MTLVDSECRVALSKLEASVADVLAARGSFAAGSDVPAPDVIGRMRAVASRADHDLVALKSDLAQLDAGLAVQRRKAGGQSVSLVDKRRETAQRLHQDDS